MEIANVNKGTLYLHDKILPFMITFAAPIRPVDCHSINMMDAAIILNSQDDDAIDGKLDRGTCLSIYWDHDSRWHCGVVDAHCPSQLYGDQVYRIKYDDGEVADANLESTKYNIVNVSLAGGRTPIDPPDGFLANDNDYQILWPETNEHTSFRPNREHITFYS